jgi:predicted GH43/DUF377 family glycosyl hydrolase
MFFWKKIGHIFNPIDIHGRFWLNEFAQAPSVLIFDNFVRIYFSCRPKANENNQYVSYSAFADFSRTDLTKLISIADKPVLTLGERGCFDEFGTYPISVIKNGQEIIAYYAGWTRCESVPFNVAIGIATSNDCGVTFKKIGSGPVLSYDLNDPFVISGPKIRKFNNKWYLFYIAGTKWIATEKFAEPVYRIKMATSDDGINWKRDGREIIKHRIEKDEAQASPDVFYCNDKYHMFFSYRHSLDFRSKEKGYRIGYAWSDDLTNWFREDSKAGIDISPNGWDSEMISYPHVFELDDNIYMLYLGNQVGRYGFGLAKLEGKL